MPTTQYTAEQLKVLLKSCRTVLVFVKATSCSNANVFPSSKTAVHNLLVSNSGDGMRFNARYSEHTKTLWLGVQ